MFALAKLRSDVARVRRHMEERVDRRSRRAVAAAAAAPTAATQTRTTPTCLCSTSRAYWAMDEYSYEMEAMSRGRFGRNMRHEASKQARHDSKRARKLQARAEKLQERISRRLAHACYLFLERERDF